MDYQALNSLYEAMKADENLVMSECLIHCIALVTQFLFSLITEEMISKNKDCDQNYIESCDKSSSV